MKKFFEDYGMVILLAWAMILVTVLIGAYVFVIISSVLY